MFICVCKAVSESEVDTLIEEGGDLESIQKKCGAGTDCGSCHRRLQSFIDEHKQSEEEKASATSTKAS